MIKVKLVSHTPLPEEVIAEAIRACYNSSAKAENLIENCIANGHESVLEHAIATFEITGVSRALTHQLVRHRIASYTQESQRYVKQSEFKYIVPPSVLVKNGFYEKYVNLMADIEKLYCKMISAGIKKEDARYILPNAATTRIFVTMNFRSLRHFIKLRIHKSAQWEIRSLAKEMLKILAFIAPTCFLDFMKENIYFMAGKNENN